MLHSAYTDDKNGTGKKKSLNLSK